MNEAVTKKLFDLCRLTTFGKTRYLQGNETTNSKRIPSSRMNEKTKNNEQQGLSLILTKNFGADKQKLNVLSTRTDTVSAVFSARTIGLFKKRSVCLKIF